MHYYRYDGSDWIIECVNSGAFEDYLSKILVKSSEAITIEAFQYPISNSIENQIGKI